MAFDSVAICNRALAKIGKGTIAALTENSEPARRCNLLYDQVRREEISAHFWGFAMARSELTADATTPDFEWEYRYPKPSDCLTVKEFYNSTADWVIEGQWIMTNEDEVYLKYASDEDDPTKFHPLFSEALACRLAIELAPYEDNPQLDVKLENAYSRALLRAAQMGAIERHESLDVQRGETEESEWETAGR